MQPADFKNSGSRQQIAELEPDLMVVVAYGLILPESVLTIPGAGCWNIHASLLPRWRGAAPIQRAIEAGDSKTGICIMQMDAGLDTGPVIQQAELQIGPDETAAELHDRLAALGSACLLNCLKRWSGGPPLPSHRQAEDGVSYAAKLEKGEARLDWSKPTLTLHRQVRAFNSWPVAWCLLQGQRLRIWRSKVSARNASVPAGTLISDPHRLFVVCADGCLELLEVQPAGKRRMSAAEFLNARTLPQSMDPL